MSFHAERRAFEAELDAYYAGYPSCLEPLESELHAISAAHAEWLPCARKAAGYEFMSRRCPIKVFRHFPFYCELDVGKPRSDLGAGGIGSWMKREPFGRRLQEQGTKILGNRS